MKTTEMTIDQLMVKLKVDRTAAYGLVQYLIQTNQAKVVRTVKPEGQKGKGANVYEIVDTISVKLS